MTRRFGIAVSGSTLASLARRACITPWSTAIAASRLTSWITIQSPSRGIVASGP